LLFISLAGFCSPIASDAKSEENDDYQADDYDNYDDDNVSSDKSKPDITKTPEDSAYLEKSEYTVEVNPGENKELLCHVKNLTSQNIIMWYRGPNLLFQGKNRIGQDQRISVNDQNSLIIKNINVDDDGAYYCNILPKGIRESINLHVKSAPISVDIKEGTKTIAKTDVEISSGTKGVEFQCIAVGGRPTPSLNWAKNVGSLMILYKPEISIFFCRETLF
jgi:hypothetical protein